QVMDSEEWWAWADGISGAWAAVVCVVVVLGTAINVAVLVHWLTARSSIDSPAQALPMADFLLCAIAAPLRYAHAPPMLPPEPESSPSLLQAITMPVVQESNDTMNHLLGNKISLVVQESEVKTEAVQIVVVTLCLTSLHVVVLVALHRLTLLMHCAPTSPGRYTAPLIVLLIGMCCAIGVSMGLHATGVFTHNLPLLGPQHLPPSNTSTPNVVIAFLLYIASLCVISATCYMVIAVTLLNQPVRRPYSSPCQSSNIRPSTSSASGSQNKTDDCPSDVGNSERQGRAIRACVTVISVVMTLTVCWVLPVTLALYTLLLNKSLTHSLPYSDVLVLLSGLIHPFVYGEGWTALLACGEGVQQTVSFLKHKIGYLKKNSSRPRQKPRDQDKKGLICWPCKSKSNKENHEIQLQ
ncbi:unnamed protein product, partial [Meganyctiphanes norvegica]